MVISHTYRYIFINQPKTGGTSMRHILENYCDGVWDRCHRSASSVEQHVGRDIWESYFKFAIVRNPFARMVSWYLNTWDQIHKRENYGDHPLSKYDKFKKDAPTFRDFILHAEVFDREECEDFYYKQPQMDFLSSSGRLEMDYIAHTETLEEDWESIRQKLKLPKIDFPHKNKTGDKRKQGYCSWYDDKLEQVMQERFARDFTQFGYDILCT